MNCINYKWPIEQAKGLAELEHIVCRMFRQFDLEYFQILYPDLTWTDLGERLAEELEEDECISNVAYWLELADYQKKRLQTFLCCKEEVPDEVS